MSADELTPGKLRTRLLTIQKRIFRSMKNEATRLLGETPEAIRLYEAEYRSDFRRQRKPLMVSKADLIQAIRSTQVSFIADFHTFSHAQKTALRLIEESIFSKEKWFIGLEMIQSRFQPELDRFQQGEIPLEDFLQAIRYYEEWGFPWRHYAPIFDWARQNHIRLIALNQPKEFLQRGESDGNELEARDRWGAGIITDLFGRDGSLDPDLRMVVLYGEMHVSLPHLPKQLEEISKAVYRKPLSSISVHQNYDPLYWRLSRSAESIQGQILKLDRRSYCVFSGTPWTKLQSVISWVEGSEENGTEQEDQEPDLLSWVKTSGTLIGEFFKMPIPPFESLNIKTVQEAAFIDEIASDPRISRQDLRLIRYHILNHHRIYVPRINLAYLATPSHNAASEIAAIHFLKQRARSKVIYDPKNPDDFFRLVLESGFGFLGSLILNPKRKCDLIDDHSSRIARLERGEKEAFQNELAARILAKHLLSNQKKVIKEGSHSRLNLLENYRTERKLLPTLMIAAKYIGYVLGLQTHRALLSKGLPLTQIKDAFFSNRHFERRYIDLLETVTGASGHLSKTEIL